VAEGKGCDLCYYDLLDRGSKILQETAGEKALDLILVNASLDNVTIGDGTSVHPQRSAHRKRASHRA